MQNHFLSLSSFNKDFVNIIFLIRLKLNISIFFYSSLTLFLIFCFLINSSCFLLNSIWRLKLSIFLFSFRLSHLLTFSFFTLPIFYGMVKKMYMVGVLCIFGFSELGPCKCPCGLIIGVCQYQICYISSFYFL